jgi:hypothetical protein
MQARQWIRGALWYLVVDTFVLSILGKGKGKGRKAGVYSALQLEEADCTLTPWRSSLIHLQRRHHTTRRESHLLAKKGTFIEGILLAIRNLLQLLGSFTWRKVGTAYLTSPPKEGMLRILYTEKIQRLRPGLNPRTREPEASMRTTRPPKPSSLLSN